MTAMVGLLPPEVSQRYPHGYAVVDVETTGLDPAADRVLQIAVAHLRADGVLERTWTTLLDPGVDPGPVNVHGLTRDRLRDAPQFPEIADMLAGLVEGRVLVAHNARFDWAFLASEASRAGAAFPVRSRLCTIALSRRLDLPVPGMSLDHIAAYWGIDRLQAHDAVDDVRVVVEVLRHSLAVACRLDATLPLARCDAGAPHPAPPRVRRVPCAFRNPGAWAPGRPLVQGMKVAFTGDTVRPRELLMRDAAIAGLDAMNNVSSQTSLLVRNAAPGSSRKAQAAAAHGTPIVDETTWMALLAAVQPGESKTSAQQERRPAGVTGPAGASAVREVQASTVREESAGPLARRRVLVLGGVHVRAAEVRERIVGLGGQAAVNLTASVTDVVLFEDAHLDARYARVAEMRLPRLDPLILRPIDGGRASAPGDVAVPRGEHAGLDPATLARGAVIDLPAEFDAWALSVTWPDLAAEPVDVDVVAFVVDADEQVRVDEDFVFYNQPAHPIGAVDLEVDTANEALAVIRPAMLPPQQRRIVIAAAIDGERTFGDVGPIELALRTAEGRLVARSTLDAATTERSMILAALYERAGTWRFRAVGQGYDTGLERLAVQHGVDIED